MFNDTSSLKSHLATRRSGKARDMVAPGPDTDELRAIIELALRTPDHGKLAPWRIITIAPEQRDAFAALLKQAWVAFSPNVGAAFGLREGDAIVGYFFIGTPGADLSERPRPDYDEIVSTWDI